MKKIGIIFGSSRPSNTGKNMSQWFTGKVKLPAGVEFEMVDLKELGLPLFNEAMPPMMDQYSHDHTKAWSEQVSGFDAVIFVAAEYNMGPTPILKNAIDYLFKEWKEKPVAFLSYGSYPTSNAVEMLRKIVMPFEMKQVDETIHITPAYKAISDEGVDESMVSGDEPQLVLDKLLALLDE